MKLSAKLILLLTVAVSLVMLAASLITLRQREAELREAARDEVYAHALTLRLALEESYAAGHPLDAQRLINRLRENTGLYSVILFDAAGAVRLISDEATPAELRYLNEARQVIATGTPVTIGRRLNGLEVLSVVMPLRVDEATVGAVEVAQPVAFVAAHITRARQDIALTELLLCATVLLVVTLVTRFSLTRPINALLGGAQAVGRGDLNYRVAAPRGAGELARLAQEFNRMADSLAEQRRAAAREAEERLNLERELRHSERLAAVGGLAAGVAHEMGAPLQVIEGRAKQLLKQPDAALETRQRNLTIICNQAERIARIVRQLLNLSRPYQLRLAPVELARLVADTAELLEAQAESAGVKIKIAPTCGYVVAVDRDLLQQVLLNIFRNGVQAMPQGGRLLIECLASTTPPARGSFAAVRVTDTGGGIAPEHLPQLFDPFFTTREIGSGTGLGLPVSRRIVEEHGGWIEAANGVNGGAVFTVYLPQAAPAVRQLALEGTSI